MRGRPVPPERMPLLRHGRPLKRWRWMAAFGPDVAACACDIRIGVARQRFWAIAEPGRPIVEGASTFGSAGVRELSGARAHVEGGDARFDLRFDERADARATLHPNGRDGYVWTRKQAGVPVRGRLELGGRAHELDGAIGVIDETAGYHRRHTSWLWCAGAGRLADGRAVGWNLVTGVNDEPSGSERAIWVDGQAPSEPGRVEIAADLSTVRFATGEELRFSAWSERAARTNLLLLRSSYRAPLGEFAGTLPGGLELAAGRGVMEWHDVRW